MSAIKSKKQLFPLLDKFFSTDKYSKNGLNVVGNETYGKQSFIYVDTDSPEERRNLESFLTNNGFTVSTEYWPGGKCAEVRVSYFRGTNWYL